MFPVNSLLSRVNSNKFFSLEFYDDMLSVNALELKYKLPNRISLERNHGMLPFKLMPSKSNQSFKLREFGER